MSTSSSFYGSGAQRKNAASRQRQNRMSNSSSSTFGDTAAAAFSYSQGVFTSDAAYSPGVSLRERPAVTTNVGLSEEDLSDLENPGVSQTQDDLISSRGTPRTNGQTRSLSSDVYGTPFTAAFPTHQGSAHVYQQQPGYTPRRSQPRRVHGQTSSADHASEDLGVTAILQQQQGLLQQIITKQDSFEEKYKLLEVKLSKVEQQTPSSSLPITSGSSSSGKKRKRVVNRKLSVSASHCFIFIPLKMCTSSFRTRL